MSIHYQILMDLWRVDTKEFIKQYFKLPKGSLSPEEDKRMFDLLLRSLPEEILLKLVAN